MGVLLVAGCSGDKHVATSPAEPRTTSSQTADQDKEDKSSGPSAPYALKLRGTYVPLESYHFIHRSIPFVFGEVPPSQRSILALEFLLQRELFAQEAAKRKHAVSDKSVRDSIVAGDLYLLGHKLDGKKVYFTKEGSEFDPSYLERFVLGYLQLPSLEAYQEEQRRELMAQFTRREIAKAETVPDKEVRKRYVEANSVVSIDYIKFDLGHYQSQLRLSQDMVKSYIDSHEKLLRAEWFKTKPRWQSDRARIELSIIKVARDQEPSKDARNKIRTALAKIRKGSDFAAVAIATSDDWSASLGGFVGWRPAQAIGYGQEVVAACEKLAVGAVSEVIETPSAYYLVRISKRSNKGLAFDQMKFTLGIRMAPEALAREQARDAAERTLASSQPLAKQYPVSKQATAPLGADLPKEIREQLTPEQLEVLMNTPTMVENRAPALRSAKDIGMTSEFIAGVGASKKLVDALWGDTAIGARMPLVYEVDEGDAFIVARIAERTNADMQAFQEHAKKIRNTLIKNRQEKAIREWAANACRDLLDSKAVAVNPALLISDATGKALKYEPCEMLIAEQ